MRIAVVEPDGAGGMIHYAYQMCHALSEHGAEVTLHTARHYELERLPHSFAVRPQMRLWPAIATPSRGARSPLATLGRKLRRVVRGVRFAREWHRLIDRLIADDPDAVQFSTIRFPFQVYGLRRLRRAGITLTQVCHEFEKREAGAVSRALFRRSTESLHEPFDLIFFHGEENRKRFLEVHPLPDERTAVIRHGNESLFLRLNDPGGDLRGRYGIAPTTPVALFFGGIRPSKGIEDLIDAFAVAAARVEATLLIVGNPVGVDPDGLRVRAARLGMGDRVVVDARYVPLDEVGPLMRTSRFVVLPYRSATASGVLQVAFAFGRPVIATRLGALAEDIAHGDTGLLVDPGDGDALAAAMVKLLDSAADAKRMGEQARTAAESEFGWGPIAREVLAATARVAS